MKKKVLGFYERMPCIADSYAISIGHEDPRVYPYTLGKAKKIAIAEHHLNASDVEWRELPTRR